MDAIRERVVEGQQWHADETRWMIWEDDKGAKKHWLWVFMTLNLWGINPWIWLTEYLQACAGNGRAVPDDLSEWLPWLMTDARLQELRNHSPPCENDSKAPLS